MTSYEFRAVFVIWLMCAFGVVMIRNSAPNNVFDMGEAVRQMYERAADAESEL